MSETLEEMRARHKREGEEDRLEFRRDLRRFAVVVAAGAVALVAGSLWLSQANCRSVGEETGRRTTYSGHSGCFVEVGGEMVPLDAWRVAGD